MPQTRVGHDYAVLIGDVVASRSFEDQGYLLETLNQGLEWVNEKTSSIQRLEVTVGDEFQGAYSDLGAALDAALYLQLRLLGRIELRFGCGWGEITRFDAERAPRAQSGPGWWAAREAMETVVELQSKKLWPKTITTRFRKHSEKEPDAVEGLVNAFLLCRDAVLANIDEKDARIALGLFFGESQDEVAKRLGISQPSVAKRQTEKGISALYRAHQGLRGLTP